MFLWSVAHIQHTHRNSLTAPSTSFGSFRSFRISIVVVAGCCCCCCIISFFRVAFLWRAIVFQRAFVCVSERENESEAIGAHTFIEAIDQRISHYYYYTKCNFESSFVVHSLFSHFHLARQHSHSSRCVLVLNTIDDDMKYSVAYVVRCDGSMWFTVFRFESFLFSFVLFWGNGHVQ